MGDKCEQPCQIVCVSQCFFGLSAYLASVRSDYHELQTRQKKKKKKKEKEKLVSLFCPLLQDVFSPFFQDGRPENDITHTSIRKKRKQGFPPGGRRQKSFNCFLINRCFITWNINRDGLFKTGPGADGDLHTQASFSSPIISSLIFHLVASVNQRIPLMKVSSTLSFWLRCQTDVGIWVGNLKGLACSSGVKGRANYIDKHAWDSSSVRQPFQQRETLSESDRTWIFLFFFNLFFFIAASLRRHVSRLTDR